MIKLAATQIENLLAVRNGFASCSDFESLYEALFDVFMEDMPYGTAKGRTGDPVEWIDARIAEMYDDEYADIVGKVAA